MSYLDRDYLLSLGNIDPELKTFLDAYPLPEINYDSLDDFKKMIEIMKSQLASDFSSTQANLDVKQTNIDYPARDGTRIRAKLYQPSTPSVNGSPLIVIYHGGGFCVGAPEDEEETCSNFVRYFNAVCVSFAYRLAPEFPFPYAIEDSWDALKWAAENAKLLDADPSLGFVIGGTSAGGNISAVLAHMARDENLSPPLTGQHLVIPTVLPVKAVPEKYKSCFLSYEQNRFAPALPVAAIDMFMRGYQPDDSDGVRWAIFNHPNGHANLPPTVFQISGLDPLRDEAIIYEGVLKEDYNIKTKIYIYPGVPHGHFGFFPFLRSSKQFRQDQVEGMAWLLGKTPDLSKVTTNPNMSFV